MKSLYKKIRRNLRLLKLIYGIFVIASLMLFLHIILDIYFKSQKSISFTGNNVRTINRVMDGPKMQLEPNSEDFHVITADQAVWNVDKNETILYRNVKLDSTLGTIRCDTVNVKENNTLLEFRGNPVFILNLKK
jgi:hypothetical protein